MNPVAVAAVADTANKNKAVQIIMVGVGGIALVGIFIMGKKIMENLQIIDDAEERKLKRGVNSLESDGYTSPAYWQSLSESKRKQLIANDRNLTAIGKEIRDGYKQYGGMSEDEEAIIGAVKRMKSRAEFSYIADWYNKEYKSDLWSDIKNALYGKFDTNEADLTQVTTHLKNIPKA